MKNKRKNGLRTPTVSTLLVFNVVVKCIRDRIGQRTWSVISTVLLPHLLTISTHHSHHP